MQEQNTNNDFFDDLRLNFQVSKLHINQYQIYYFCFNKKEQITH